MITNHFKMAWRNLRKHKFYAFLHVFGLATGLTAALFILLYVQDELSYDRFHHKGDRMYRLTERFRNGDEYTTTAMTPYKIAPLVAEYSPAVESFTRIDTYIQRQLLQVGDKKFEEEALTYTDSTFFQNFSIDLLQGNPASVLTEPYTMVIAADKAEAYFGRENPVGKTITMTQGYSGEKYEVSITGVMEPMPANMHFHFDFLLSMATADILFPNRMESWGWTSQYSYIVLKEGHSIAEVEPLLKDILAEQAPESFQKWAYFGVQPMTDIHLHSNLKDEIQANGSMANVYVFSIIGMFILLIAGINYMNLATARAADRAKEVGLRKVVGARQSHLVNQFLCESVLVALLAFALALCAVPVLLPYFNQLAGKTLALQLLTQPGLVASCFCSVMAIGLFAGSYPAFVLSAFQPMKVLKGLLAKTGMQTLLLRKGLVIFQFTLSIILIIGTVVIYNQWEYLRTKSLGINTEQMLILPIRSVQMLNNYQNFKEELLKDPEVISVTGANKTPLSVFTNYATLRVAEREEEYTLPYVAVSEDFFETYETEIILGRDFQSFEQDSNSIILNEAAVKLLDLQDPVGQSIPFGDVNTTVVGVVKDFNFESLYSEIRPMYFYLSTGDVNFITVRIRPGDVPGVLAHLQRSWDRFDFAESLQFSFLDEDINQRYQSEARFLKIFSVFAILAILIACLGIFGLASHTAVQRTKEIGIRKVLGASAANIVTLLSKDFLRLVLVALILAAPLAWYFMDRWLENYAYRIGISWWVFILAGVVSLGIAFLTVGFQSVKAALANPVESLRSE